MAVEFHQAMASSCQMLGVCYISFQQLQPFNKKDVAGSVPIFQSNTNAQIGELKYSLLLYTDHVAPSNSLGSPAIVDDSNRKPLSNVIHPDLRDGSVERKSPSLKVTVDVTAKNGPIRQQSSGNMPTEAAHSSTKLQNGENSSIDETTQKLEPNDVATSSNAEMSKENFLLS